MARRGVTGTLLLAALVRYSTAGGSRNLTWGIPIFTRIVPTRMAAISAVSSSFIFEGTITYAWRDDNLWWDAYDGDPYTVNIAPSSAYFEVSKSGRKYFPLITSPAFQSVSQTSYNRISWITNYGPLDWTGTPDTPSNCSKCKTIAADDDPTDFDPDPVWVVGTHAFSVTFSQIQELKDFPFDTQTVSFTAVNSEFPASAMYFVIAPESAKPSSPSSTLVLARDPDGFTTIGWKATVSGSGTETASRFTVTYTLQRIPTFFINRFIVPLTLLFCMVTLFISAAPSSRLMAPLTGFGSTISFLFVSGQSVPQLPYTTRLDRFFTLCFFYSFILFCYSMFINWRFERIKPAIEKSKVRSVATGGTQAVWFEPSKVPAPVKPAKNYDAMVADKAPKKAVVVKEVVTEKGADGNNADVFTRFSMSSPMRELKSKSSPKEAKEEDLAPKDDDVMKQVLEVLKDIARASFATQRKEFLVPESTRPISVLSILWGNTADLTQGAERCDLFFLPLALASYAIFASLILTGALA